MPIDRTFADLYHELNAIADATMIMRFSYLFKKYGMAQPFSRRSMP
ncbi:MAG: hypothetical protein O2971_20085 [Proteobacteria bacterium]|nr:hypothetical protein [Pseudomonadota bacterium]